MTQFAKPKLECFGTFDIPTYILPYLIYDDASGLVPVDIKAADDWWHRATTGFASVVVDYAADPVSEFNHDPAFGDPCDTISCDLYGFRKQ